MTYYIYNTGSQVRTRKRSPQLHCASKASKDGPHQCKEKQWSFSRYYTWKAKRLEKQ